MIIGLTGFCCSGKDTVADYISQKYGYKHFSLSDVIREIIKKVGLEPVRENLVIFGTKIREENGNGVLARKVLEKTRDGGRYCITSIRHSEEINELKKRKNFVLINIDASQDIRFERMQRRKRPGDPKTLKKFVEFEERESQVSGSWQQLKKTANMADITFINDSNDITILKATVNNLLKNLGIPCKSK
ncbi:MAG: dephospho-CoA kinase [Endomicrobium sp.]|jgi:dephospho-CoA kinase|nr:dephospho-CoA kinase [Endomicrobium sp.]